MNEFFFLAYCLAVGSASGFLGGLLGIGGGVIIVPALILWLDGSQLLPASAITPAAVATSLGCIVFTSLAAGRAQMRAGMVLWPVVRRLGPPLVLGGVLAGWIAVRLPLPLFRGIIGLFLLFVSFVMLTSWKPHPHRQFPNWPLAAPLGIAGGLISGVAGIGGGNVIVPTLIFFNQPVHRATATSSVLGVPIALAGVTGFGLAAMGQPDLGPGYLGYLNWRGLLALVAGAIVMAPVGVRAAHRIQPLPLRRGFGLLLILVAGRMLYSAVAAAP